MTLAMAIPNQRPYCPPGAIMTTISANREPPGAFRFASMVLRDRCLSESG